MPRLPVFLALLTLPIAAWADAPASQSASAPTDVPPPSAQATTQAQPVPQQTLIGDWLGARTALHDKGIDVSLELQTDINKNLRGGLDTGSSVTRLLFEPTISFDTEPLLGLHGGRVFVDFQIAQGPGTSDKLVGDLQGVDNIDQAPHFPGQNRVQVAQLWYEQKLLDDKLRIKAGKVDANSEFDRATNATEFVNQSAGASPTILFIPTFPDPATGINVFLQPTPDFQIGFGLYDGSLARVVLTGAQGPKTFFHDPEDLFLIAEVDKSYAIGADKLVGRIGVGGWWDTNRFATFGGGTTPGTGGPYLVLDQTLWRAKPADANDPRGIGAYLMYGYADPSVTSIDHHAGGGIAWTGPIPGRPTDVLGVGANYAHLTRAADFQDDFELSTELFYRLQLTPWFAVKPDFQYVTNPGGRGVPDAFVAILRFDVLF